MQRDSIENADKGKDEKQSDADAHGKDQDKVWNRRNLSGKHLKIRLGDGNQDAQGKPENQDELKILCLRHF